MKTQKIKITSLYTIMVMVLTLIVLAGCSSPAPANSQSGPTFPLEINWLDKSGQYTLDDQGRLKSTVQLSSVDGRLGLFIYSGTKILDKDNKPLPNIKATIDSQPPLMPENTDVVGAVYDLSPSGSQFNPAPQITVSYSPQELPSGANESDLYVASYDNGSWNMIRVKKVDTVNHKITTSLDHNSKIAVLIPLQQNASTPAISSDVPAAPANPNAVKVVVAGYMNHGPLQPTIQAIKDVMAKYGDKVAVTWVDLGTQAGVTYFKQNGLTAHMNIIINGKFTYNVNGKDVTFQWFEGQQWTKADLESVISGLVSK
jgi:hypothetical protein